MTSLPSALSTAEPTRGRLLALVSSVDHKVIGLLYMLTALVFFAVAGTEALVLRLQLAVPNNDLVSPHLYNQLFTMHGTSMIFLVGMPVLSGFANYFVPLMIGARDVAFPRLNALGFWLLPLGGFLLHWSFLTGSAPDAGWFSYPPLSGPQYSTLHGIDYWILGLLLLGIGSVTNAINLLVTIVCHRTRGMSMQRLPLYVWMVFVTAILTVLAIPALNAALVMLLGDRMLDSGFFEPNRGGSAVLWQHFFWVFGHPEVYILALPAFGMISEVIPVFSRKPIYGYTIVALSTVVIALLSFGVWAHHMFAVGLGSGPDIFFAIGSMLIAIPTGIKIFNWTATMWGGSLHLTTAMKFAIAFLVEFVIGGLATDTYFVVAHFHYVLFGGTVFALFAATYYWFPKITGRMLDERLGRWHFWLTFAGFNATFFVQHFLGVMGMPRRVYTYADHPGWGALNMISTIGAAVLGVGMVLFVANLLYSRLKGVVSGPNPWGAFTLEWATTSPPPEYDFEQVPPVLDRRPVWSLDHPELADWKSQDTPNDDGHRPGKARISAVFFVLSEAVFFILLLAAFVVFNSRTGDEASAASRLDVVRTALFSICLLSSSVTVWLAERALARGDRRRMTAWLGATIALGLVFLGGQAIEYTGLLQEHVTVAQSLFGATFFAVTGFHGLHVLGGLFALSLMLFFARRGDLDRDRGGVLGAVSIYWHFVDAVWILVFSIVYLGALR